MDIEKNMKNLNYSTRKLLIGLSVAFFSFGPLLPAANAQGIDLKELKAQKEAESIKTFTDSLALFYNLVSGATAKSLNGSGGKIAGAGLKERAEKVRNEIPAYISNLEGLINKLKAANRFNDQFDKDVATLLGSNKVKGLVTKIGGARKLLGNGLNSSALNSLKKDVGFAAETLEIIRNNDVCQIVAVGIMTEALLFKKAATANNKFYEQYGCSK